MWRWYVNHPRYAYYTARRFIVPLAYVDTHCFRLYGRWWWFPVYDWQADRVLTWRHPRWFDARYGWRIRRAFYRAGFVHVFDHSRTDGWCVQFPGLFEK